MPPASASLPVALLLSTVLAATVPGADTGVVRCEPQRFRDDDAQARCAERLAPGSHLKVFIPSLPYIYISHAINGAFLRPANNARGWDYDLATAHRQVDATTYEFTLRPGVRFQDGTPFDADAVLLNMEHFRRKPFLFTKIDSVFAGAEKVDERTVRFHLSEPYGQFLNDCVWIQFYTRRYLERFGWNGKAVCPNLAEPGPYGLGPFILKEGYIEGDRQTPSAVLEANPYYWDARYPLVRTVTVYTELRSEEAMRQVLDQEGALDIAPIPFSAKVRTLMSPYAKVVAAPSTNSWAVHLNLRNGNPRLLDQAVRVALNQAVDQDALLQFVYDGEGMATPVFSAPLLPGVREVCRELKPYSQVKPPGDPARQAELRRVLDGLRLKVLTQDRFVPLWRGLEYQLGRVGVALDLEVTASEKDIFAQLLTTNAKANTKAWDLLSWGCDDWYYNHPWSTFLVYRTTSFWSTIMPDPVLDGKVNQLFAAQSGSPGFTAACEGIMRHVYERGYMLSVPSPNTVLAVNKEVAFRPYQMAALPLWEIAVSRDHWSVRTGAYPAERRDPVRLVRYPVSTDQTGGPRPAGVN